MKKELLTAACVFLAGQANATVIDNINMYYYDKAAPRLATGYVTSTTDVGSAVGTNPGTIDTVAGTGSFYGDTDFYGHQWQADFRASFDVAGTNTWSGWALPGNPDKIGPIPRTYFNYTFDLAPGDIAVGLFFDWNYSTDIPVLTVFTPDGVGGYYAKDQYWTDYYGIMCGSGMQTAPFPGEFPAFYNSTLGDGGPFSNVPNCDDIVGCDGVPGSGVFYDCAGVCGGDAGNDHCGVCNGDGTSCIDCTTGFDACGVCGGDGSTCPGCDGVLGSGLVVDACGVCGGDGSTCSPPVTIDNIYMYFYDAASPRFATGYVTPTTDVGSAVGTNPGTIDLVAGTGSFYGDVPFFGKVWQADLQMVDKTAGINTWSGYALPGPPDKLGNIPTTFFNYTYDLAAGDIAVGLYFDWDTYLDIPFLAVFTPDGTGNYYVKDQYWTDYYGVICGSGMQTAPFPGQFPAFYNSTIGDGAPFPNAPDCTGLVRDCLGVAGGSAVVDECGVCNGDNTSCADCFGVPNGGAIIDACGVCGGDGSTCPGCDGVLGSGLVLDSCGVCGGDNSTCTVTGIIDNINMSFYDAAIPRLFTGYTTPTTDVGSAVGTNVGTIDLVAGTGSFYGDVDFFGNRWQADLQTSIEAAGTHTWSGYALPGPPDKLGNIPTTYFNYTFDLAAGDIAVGLYFDWSTNIDIPVLTVFTPDGAGGWYAKDQLWTDYYGIICGSGMQTAPFPGQFPAFYNSTIGDGSPFLNDGCYCAGVIDCNGVCDGGAVVDCNGVCGGNVVVDQCGVCGGDDSFCAGCDAVPNSGLVIDACGVCGGDNSSCADCNGVPNGGAVVDICGVCGGGDSCSCCGCDGWPNSGVEIDACGVCGGDNSSCTDCNGVLYGGAVVDACGVCGGDGTTCELTICHQRTLKKKTKWKTITVSGVEVGDHYAHGDYPGECVKR